MLILLLMVMVGYWYCSSCRINVQLVIDEKVVVLVILLVILLVVLVLLGITVIWVVAVVASVEGRGRPG